MDALCEVLGADSIAHVCRRLCGRLDLALPPRHAVMLCCRKAMEDPRVEFSVPAVERFLGE